MGGMTEARAGDEPAVALTELGGGVVQVTLQDRAGRNAFTHAIIDGLTEAFERVREERTWRVVILTGYDSYFSSGGTQDALLAMQEGRASFADVGLYSLPLVCELPVIAAMQGHGIGGGFILGLFADLVILAEESVYAANFMEYGFTPGMGATCVVPRKLGLGLGEELLLTGARYRGEALARRGVPFPVLPRREVLAHARELAAQLAEKPREALVALKAQLVGELRRELPRAIEAEVAMQARTFRQPEVRQRILERFGR